MVAACGDDDRPKDNTPCPELSFQPCNVFTELCQARVYRYDECARQYVGSGIPDVTQISKEQYRKKLESDLQKKSAKNPKAARLDTVSTVALSLLNLAPPGLQSLDQASIEQQAATTLAFYSLADKRVTLIDQGHNPEDLKRLRLNTIVLGHEFVHAQQDEEHDLLQFYATHFDESSDGYYAWRTIVEGEASFVELLIEAVDIHKKLDPAKLQAYLETIETTQKQSALKHNQPFTASLRYFPYRYGFSYMAKAYLQDDLAGLAHQYKLPPTSVVDFFFNPRGPRIPRIDVQWHDGSQSDDLPAIRDRLGAWALFSFLGRNGIETPQAFELARHWRGDAMYAQGDAQGMGVGVLWRVAFANSVQAQLVKLAQDLSQKMRVTAGGTRDNFQIWADNNELMIVAVQDRTQLESWRQRAESMKRPPRKQTRQKIRFQPLPRRFFDHPHPHPLLNRL